jgi:hypothetical protein
MFFKDEEKEIQNLHDNSTLSVSFWASLIGTKVRHNNYGDGIIHEVEMRKDAEPVVKIQFGYDHKFRKDFLFSSFVDGKFTFLKNINPKIKRYTEAIMQGMQRLN